MRRTLITACAAGLLALTACTAETATPVDSSPAAPAAAEADSAPAPEGAAVADRELETIRIDVMGMG